MDFFDLNQTIIANYKAAIKSKAPYDKNSELKKWHLKIRDQLMYLAKTELSKALGKNLKVVYTQRPAKQAGRGKGLTYFEYILIGFVPDDTNYKKERVFIKLEFSLYKDPCTFKIEIDTEHSKTNKNVEKHTKEFTLDDSFPKDWSGMVALIKNECELKCKQWEEIMNITTTNQPTQTNTNTGNEQLFSHPLNLILYGPPGTGKTYDTLFHALSIIKKKNIDDLRKEVENGTCNYSDLKKEYDELVKSGQIVFTTFHQSLSYEDFIEGIKPEVNDDTIAYERKDGIFKQLCIQAKKIETTTKSESINFDKTRVFKMSLGEKGKDADYIFDYCINENVVGLGWGNSTDFSECKTKEDIANANLDKPWAAKAIEILKITMQKNDVILISDGLYAVKGIAQIDGDYEFRDDPSINIHQFRKVKWLYKGDPIPISKLYDKSLSQQSIYGFFKEKKNGIIDNGNIKCDVINDIITSKVNNEDNGNYVLIIDEINRGNVSQIFGELITLLEESKRIGNKEALHVTLPYSQKPFGVPNNLYVIGTMNTADRSVEALDTALRRRFSFEEMMPNPKLCVGTVCNYKLSDMLTTINDRIRTLKDREHQIGHSYLMNCPEGDDNLKEEWLKTAFKDKIIPLLQEYFYGNYSYIGLVLGNGFVKEDTDANNPSFADFDGDNDFESEGSYRLLTEEEWDKINMKDALDMMKIKS